MKKLALRFLILLIAVSIAGFATAETFRQGEVRYTFNPRDISTKTAAYTAVAADTQINVTTSTANLAVTLPSIASLRPNTKSYKILKTDATTFNVVVTPATGNTIGGESTRYLTYQNAYMIITTSSGNSTDWQVVFESPYVVEDYEAGTVKISSGEILKVFVIDGTTVTGGAKTLTAADCGLIISDQDATPATTWTLPANATAGCEFTFLNAIDQTASDTITSATADTINCMIDVNDASYTSNAADVVNIVNTADTLGDFVICVSDGTSWFCRGVGEASGSITCTG